MSTQPLTECAIDSVRVVVAHAGYALQRIYKMQVCSCCKHVFVSDARSRQYLQTELASSRLAL